MSPFIRQFHRWTSAAFVLSVIATTIALAQKEPVMWMSYVPLAPLALLALTGIYMFFLPYARKRGARGGQEQAG
jgi:hypothetical protein